MYWERCEKYLVEYKILEKNIKTVRWNSHRMGKRGTLKSIDFWNFHLLSQGKKHKSWLQPPPIIQNPKLSPK